MFEVAELGRKLDRAGYESKVPQVRDGLLDAQFRLKDADFSVAIVIAGAEGSGKGELVNRLLNWLDARGVATHAMGAPTSEESERPEFYKFWRRLPPKGSITIFFGSWYTKPIVDHICGRIGNSEMDRRMSRIVEFKQMLVQENTLLLKLWLHISGKEQGKRFKKLAANPLTA